VYWFNRYRFAKCLSFVGRSAYLKLAIRCNNSKRQLKAVSNLRAPTLHFSVIDVFGVNVNVTIKRWNTKILKRQQFKGREDLVKDAINNPEVVFEGNTSQHKEFKGHPTSGSGFYFGGQSIVAVVWYPPGRDGVLTTVYSTSQSLQGKILWPHS
jgi:hypothetical protein